MKTFNQIAQELLKIPAGQVRDDITPKDVPDWDSMNYLIFISELEKEFDISFTMDEVLNAKSLGEVKNIIKSKGVAL